MKVIIAGSRDINDVQHVYAAMDEAFLILRIEPTEVVSGKARGVDTAGETWAKRFGIPVAEFPARWRDPDGTFYADAGKRRNVQMANYADALVAVWDGRSYGTKHMITQMHKRKKPVWVYISSEHRRQLYGRL